MKKTITTIAAIVLTISSLLAQNKSEPIFKVGIGRDRMPSVEFKSQTECRIELNNNVFYRVKNADIIFHLCDSSGNEILKSENIKSNILNITGYMTKLKPGDIIEFKNIIGIDTSGITKNIKPRVFTLY